MTSPQELGQLSEVLTMPHGSYEIIRGAGDMVGLALLMKYVDAIGQPEMIQTIRVQPVATARPHQACSSH